MYMLSDYLLTVNTCTNHAQVLSHTFVCSVLSNLAFIKWCFNTPILMNEVVGDKYINIVHTIM